MATLQGQVEKMFRDVTRGPDLTDSIEVGVLGAVLGAALGYAKERSGRAAKGYAIWGAGLGVAGQYMLFQMLKPALRASGGRFYAGGQSGPAIVGGQYGPAIVGVQSGPAIVGVQSGPSIVGHGRFHDPRVGAGGLFPATGCPKGTYWDEFHSVCTPIIPPPPPLPPQQPFPDTLDEWRRLHATSGGYYTGAVAGLSGIRGGGMPYGPGPWPNQGAQNPNEVGWG